MVGFTHLTLSQLRNEAEYNKAVEKVRAEQFRLSNELDKRLSVALVAQKKIGKQTLKT